MNARGTHPLDSKSRQGESQLTAAFTEQEPCSQGAETITTKKS